MLNPARQRAGNLPAHEFLWLSQCLCSSGCLIRDISTSTYVRGGWRGNGGCRRGVKPLHTCCLVPQSCFRQGLGFRQGGVLKTPDPAGSAGSSMDFSLRMQHTSAEVSAAASMPGGSADIRSLNGYWSLGPGKQRAISGHLADRPGCFQTVPDQEVIKWLPICILRSSTCLQVLVSYNTSQTVFAAQQPALY